MKKKTLFSEFYAGKKDEIKALLIFGIPIWILIVLIIVLFCN